MNEVAKHLEEDGWTVERGPDGRLTSVRSPNPVPDTSETQNNSPSRQMSEELSQSVNGTRNHIIECVTTDGDPVSMVAINLSETSEAVSAVTALLEKTRATLHVCFEDGVMMKVSGNVSALLKNHPTFSVGFTPS